MFLNPKQLIDDGSIKIPDDVDINKCLQQNGVDVTCDNVLASTLGSRVRIGIDDKQTLKRTEMPITTDKPYWRLARGYAYEFMSRFHVNIPKDTCGWLLGRSTFNRNGILIRSGLYDAGFCNYVGGTIYCFEDIDIEKGTRIAQLVIAQGESAQLYDGQYQQK